MAQSQIYKYLSITAFAAALMVAAMFAVSLFNGGVTAQNFELVSDVESYTREIQAAEASLRLILTFDNLFLMFYSAAFIFLAMASNKSPVPDPVVAEIGTGSPRESLLNSATSFLSFGLSVLLATNIIFLLFPSNFFKIKIIFLSSPKSPARVSTRNRIKSACFKYSRACPWTIMSISSVASTFFKRCLSLLPQKR